MRLVVLNTIWATSWETQFFALCENKSTDWLWSNCTAYHRLCFRYIVQSLYFLNLKFQASSNLLWQYSPVSVVLGFLTTRLNCFKPRRRSHNVCCLVLQSFNILNSNKGGGYSVLLRISNWHPSLIWKVLVYNIDIQKNHKMKIHVGCNLWYLPLYEKLVSEYDQEIP